MPENNNLIRYFNLLFIQNIKKLKGDSIMKLALFNLREDERPFVDAWLS